MSRRLLAAAMAAVLFLPASLALHAAPLDMFHHTAADKSSAGKVIHFSIRNDSKQPLVLQAGDQQYTVKSGKSISMKLPEGTSVITVNGTSSAAPGAVLTTVSSTLQDNTLAVS